MARRSQKYRFSYCRGGCNVGTSDVRADVPCGRPRFSIRNKTDANSKLYHHQVHFHDPPLVVTSGSGTTCYVYILQGGRGHEDVGQILVHFWSSMVLPWPSRGRL